MCRHLRRATRQHMSQVVLRLEIGSKLRPHARKEAMDEMARVGDGTNAVYHIVVPKSGSFLMIKPLP